MTDETDNARIRGRARAIWEREGKPEGRAREYWEQATRELGLQGTPEALPPPEMELEPVEPAKPVHKSRRARKQSSG